MIVVRYYSTSAREMTLTSGITAAAVTIALDTVVGLPVSLPFTLVLDADREGEEVVTVTALGGNVATVVRGQDGTAAVLHSSGAPVRHRMTARDLLEPQQHIAATTGVHGLAAGDSPASAAALVAEATARSNADTSEATTRGNADTANANAIAAEATSRANADGLLVPKTTKVNGHALSADVAVTLADLGITSGTVLPGTLPTGNVFLLIVG